MLSLLGLGLVSGRAVKGGPDGTFSVVLQCLGLCRMGGCLSLVVLGLCRQDLSGLGLGLCRVGVSLCRMGLFWADLGRLGVCLLGLAVLCLGRGLRRVRVWCDEVRSRYRTDGTVSAVLCLSLLALSGVALSL